MSYEMNDLLELMVDQGASDLHLQVNQPPTLRLSGGMVPIDGPALTPSDTEKLMLSITPDNHQQNVKLNGGSDFGFAYMEKARLRVSVLKSKGNYGMVLRQIPNKMFSLREIGLPDKVRELLYRPRGLILVTGPTGSGKSTTLASMINYINETRDGHIITIEDPIEYYHPHKHCIVTQREIGVDVPSFSEAIRRALRQDPDIILVGEMRDLETIEAAISAAETGHLVFGTLHTNGAAKTIDRIVDAFPANMKDMIRTQLASSIVAVISQVLCKKIGGGRIAGYEIMVNTTSIAHPREQDLPYILRHPDRRRPRHDHDGRPSHEPGESRTRCSRRGPRQSPGPHRDEGKTPRDGRLPAPTLIFQP
jgi:twitching motility protein PilT